MSDPKKPFVFVSPASQKVPKEISLSSSKINVLAPKTPAKEITPSQGVLHLDIELTKDVNGIGMGVLSDGAPYLNQCSAHPQGRILDKSPTGLCRETTYTSPGPDAGVRFRVGSWQSVRFGFESARNHSLQISLMGLA